MITSSFIHKQRLGNQLFIYASLLGIAKKNNTVVNCIPRVAHYLKNTNRMEILDRDSDSVIYEEKSFSYDSVKLATNIVDYNLKGYFQSNKYFENIIPKFQFEDYLAEKADTILSKLPKKETIAIHIRRGDYVDNPNYVLLPATYYITALIKYFPNYEDYNILIFSDDIPYCRVHFSCLPNVYFSEGNDDIEDLVLMSRCKHFIISNSSYSWWGAYLGETEKSIIIRPEDYFEGKLLETHDIKDLYPVNWYAHNKYQLDLSDCTFMIPVKYDHKDRKKNLDLTVCMLQKDFYTNIRIGEMGNNVFRQMEKYNCSYTLFNMKLFHRTKMLNDMTAMSYTPIVINYDADVIIPPMQMYLAVKAIRDGYHMVYPYDGRFARMDRKAWFLTIENRLDIGFVRNTVFKGMLEGVENTSSVGGCVLFNRQAFLDGGGENEEFISFGDEDNERYFRFKTLGYKVGKIKGCLYHMNHYTGVDSTTRNPYWKANRELWNKIKEMNKEELKQYIKDKFTWKK